MQDPRRLYKSTNEKMIFGVAGGLAEYFDVDPVLVRLVLILLAFASAGTMILVYIIAAIIMPTGVGLAGPSEPLSDRIGDLGHDASEAAQRAGDAFRSFAGGQVSEEARERRRKTAGLILIAIGAIILLANFGWWWFSWSTWWPVALIAAGALIIFGRARGTRR